MLLPVDPVLRADDERRLGNVQHAGAAGGLDPDRLAVQLGFEGLFAAHGDPLADVHAYDLLLVAAFDFRDAGLEVFERHHFLEGACSFEDHPPVADAAAARVHAHRHAVLEDAHRAGPALEQHAVPLEPNRCVGDEDVVGGLGRRDLERPVRELLAGGRRLVVLLRKDHVEVVLPRAGQRLDDGLGLPSAVAGGILHDRPDADVIGFGEPEPGGGAEVSGHVQDLAAPPRHVGLGDDLLDGHLVFFERRAANADLVGTLEVQPSPPFAPPLAAGEGIAQHEVAGTFRRVALQEQHVPAPAHLAPAVVEHLGRQIAVGHRIVGIWAEAIVGDGNVHAAEQFSSVVAADPHAVVIHGAVVRADAAVVLVAGAGRQRRALPVQDDVQRVGIPMARV